jgi:hypothetical protein
MEDPEELTICSAIQLSAKRYATESSACMCISRASIMEAVRREKNIQNIGDQKYPRIQPFLAGISSNTLAKCGAFPCLLPATPGVTKPAAVAGSRSR